MIALVVPTRGRPERFAEMVRTFKDTSVMTGTELFGILDADDPRLEDYRSMDLPVPLLVEHGNMVERSNIAARFLAGVRWDIIGWGSDDLFYRTPGWDLIVEEALPPCEVGMVGTNDGHFGAGKWQQVFMTRYLYYQLDWLCLPTVNHLHREGFGRAWWVRPASRWSGELPMCVSTWTPARRKPRGSPDWLGRVSGA